MTQKELYERARVAVSKKYKEEMQELRERNRKYVNENIRLRTENFELRREVSKLRSVLKTPRTFVDMMEECVLSALR